MQNFVRLYRELEESSSPDEKEGALMAYFQATGGTDILWAITLLGQNRPKRSIKLPELQKLAIEFAGIPEWLFETSLQQSGDLTETITLVLPKPSAPSSKSLTDWMRDVENLASLDKESRTEGIIAAWQQLEPEACFIFNKLITGGFRLALPQKTITAALASYSGQKESILAHRLSENWTPHTLDFESLLGSEETQSNPSQPYPFFTHFTLQEAPENLGKASEWQAEQQLPGLQAQVIIRNGECFIWLEDGTLVTDKFPELQPLSNAIPEGVVMIGRIVALKNEEILPIQHLEARLTRKSLTKSLLQEAPAVFFAQDLLEWAGENQGPLPFAERRLLLEKIAQHFAGKENFNLSTFLPFVTWEALKAVRNNLPKPGQGGLVLRDVNAAYLENRVCFWKADPIQIEAVLMYAQNVQGQAANWYTEFSFGAWDGDQLVPIVKLEWLLNEEELNELNNWIRFNTLERFGPVRSVKPAQVFQLSFAAIQASKRHKSGIVLLSAQLLNWQKGKQAKDAAQLSELKQWIK